MPRDLPSSDAAHAGRETAKRINLFLPLSNSTFGNRLSTKRVNLLRMPKTTTRARRRAGRVRLPYMPGLDGLRALAVVAVLLYHAELAWIPGGFLGVEVFFVISGYLITSLLLREWGARGRVDLKAFWLGRARRLLPALFVMIGTTLGFAVVFLPEEVVGLRMDALAAFGYATNWYLIFSDQSYFEAAGRPSLLKHLWSLAIEEQFYVLWPCVVAAGMGVGALRYRRRRLLFAVLAGAAASALLMAILYEPGVEPSRIYYGTDTRAAGLLVGAVLAFVWAPDRFFTRGAIRRALARGRSWWIFPLLLDVAGLAALGGLVWSCLRLDEFDPFLYRGGYALVALSSATLIAALVHPHARLNAGLLRWKPLRWVGLRSYGIYLWHWPVFMVTRPRLDVPLDGLPLLALRLSATVLLAALSYRYVEEPIRRGALGRAWKTLRESRGARRWRLGARWAGTAMPVVALCVALGLAVGHAQPPKPPSYLSSMQPIHTERPPIEKTAEEASGTTASTDTTAATPEEVPATEAETDPATQDTRDGGTPVDAPSTAPRKTPPVVATPAEVPEGRVSAIGDSVMLGAAATLTRTVPALGVMDAEVGTQVSTGIEILRARRDAGQLGDVVVVHLGNNGAFTAEQFDEMMGILGDERGVVFVNIRVPRTWEGPNNAVLAEGVVRHPNAVLVDWYAASIDRPGLFWDDGMHLRPKGQKVYADLVASHLEAFEATAATPAAPEGAASAAGGPAGRVAAVGDSVMLGAVDALVQEIPNLGIVDAQGCRQAPAAIDLLREWRAAGQLGDVVVVHVGSNGPFYPEQFDQMMGVLEGVRKVVVVNVTVPPGVEDPVAVPNNAVLADGAGRYPNAVLIDWYAASVGHPEFFWEDGTHLTPEGAWAYAGLIAAGTHLAPSQETDSSRSGEPSVPPVVLADAGCPVTQ